MQRLAVPLYCLGILFAIHRSVSNREEPRGMWRIDTETMYRIILVLLVLAAMSTSVLCS